MLGLHNKTLCFNVFLKQNSSKWIQQTTFYLYRKRVVEISYLVRLQNILPVAHWVQTKGFAAIRALWHTDGTNWERICGIEILLWPYVTFCEMSILYTYSSVTEKLIFLFYDFGGSEAYQACMVSLLRMCMLRNLKKGIY